MNRSQINPLSNEQISKLAPAAGAPTPSVRVSNKYNFVPTIAAVNLLRDAGWLPVAASQAKVRLAEKNGFQKHLIRFTHHNRLLQSNSNRMDILLYNSHDAGCSFQLMAGVYRFACANGLVIGNTNMHFAHKHINFDSTAFIESAYKIAGGADQIGAQVNLMQAIELTPDERGVFASAAHQLVYDAVDDAPIRPEQLLRERRYEDKGNDLWTTFNIVQENIMKGGIDGRKRDANGRMRWSKTRAVKSLDRDIKLNRALWLLIEEMARLKTN